MLPKYHFIIGILASVLLYLILNLTLMQVFIIFLASFLMDIDHYFFYIFKTKNYNLNKAHKWFVKRRKIWFSIPPEQRRNYKKNVFIFHGIEFIILLGILSLFYNLFLYILIGVILHMIFDFIEFYYKKEAFYSKISSIWTYFKNKKLSRLNE